MKKKRAIEKMFIVIYMKIFIIKLWIINTALGAFISCKHTMEKHRSLFFQKRNVCFGKTKFWMYSMLKFKSIRIQDWYKCLSLSIIWLHFFSLLFSLSQTLFDKDGSDFGSPSDQLTVDAYSIDEKEFLLMGNREVMSRRYRNT